MKKIIILLLLTMLMLSHQSYGQTSKNNQAKAYFFAAQEAFSNKQYDDALKAVDKVESLLGKSNALLSALKVKTYYQQRNFIKAKSEIEVFFGFKANDALAREVSSYLIKIDNGIEEQKRKELAENERLARVKGERLARDEAERKRLVKENAERIAREIAERERVTKERLEKQKIEKARIEAKYQKEQKLRQEGKPVPIKRVAPRYPPMAARDGINGWVIVSFTVSKTGRIQNCKVVEEQPERYFNKAACTAVNQWIYEPATLNGLAIEYLVKSLQLDFKMNE